MTRELGRVEMDMRKTHANGLYILAWKLHAGIDGAPRVGASHEVESRTMWKKSIHEDT